MRNRKRELFDEQRKKKKDIQILQIQLKRTEEFEAWEASKKSEVNFIRTKGEQNPIYWLPKNHSEKTEERSPRKRAASSSSSPRKSRVSSKSSKKKKNKKESSSSSSESSDSD